MPKKVVRKRTKNGGTTKAQAIRDMAKELGKKARPRDIIAALAAKRIVVTSPQVSMTLKSAGLRKGKRRRKGAAVASSNGQNHSVNLDHLLKVKKLADQLGGTSQIKEAMAALERLM